MVPATCRYSINVEWTEEKLIVYKLLQSPISERLARNPESVIIIFREETCCRELCTEVTKELRSQTECWEIINSRELSSPLGWGWWKKLCSWNPRKVSACRSWNYREATCWWRSPQKQRRREWLTLSFCPLSSLWPDRTQAEASRPRNMGSTISAPSYLSNGGGGCKDGHEGERSRYWPEQERLTEWEKWKPILNHLFFISAALVLFRGSGTLEGIQNIS